MPVPLRPQVNRRVQKSNDELTDIVLGSVISDRINKSDQKSALDLQLKEFKSGVEQKVNELKKETRERLDNLKLKDLKDVNFEYLEHKGVLEFDKNVKKFRAKRAPKAWSLGTGYEIATQTETDAGTNDTTIVTPLKLATYSGLGGAVEGTAVLSTGPVANTKFLRADGDGTCSWQTPAGSGDLLADGTVPLTANWDVGAYTITGTQFISDIATGTAPFVVASTTVVANLNASTLEGNAAAAFATALGADDNYVTDAEKVVIGNTSGTNSGDMSNADVKTAYEANADTNAVTDAEKTVIGNTSGTNTGDNTVATAAASQVITDNALVTVDDADAANNDYAKFTANGLEGRSYAQVVDDIGSSIDTVGTIGTGVWEGTDVGIAHGGTGASTLAGASIPTYTSTNTFTNKRITARVWTVASDATPDVDTDDYDAVTITAQAAAITDMNFTGTPTNFQKIIVRIKDNGTGRAITWGSDFEAKGVALPTTTTASKVLTTGFIFDTVTSKWGCVASVEEA